MIILSGSKFWARGRGRDRAQGSGTADGAWPGLPRWTAAPTCKKTYGHHPLTVFADHGPEGTGEALAVLLRAGNAGSDTAAGHIEAARLGLAQLPRDLRRRVLLRTDSGGG